MQDPVTHGLFFARKIARSSPLAIWTKIHLADAGHTINTSYGNKDAKPTMITVS